MNIKSIILVIILFLAITPQINANSPSECQPRPGARCNR